jgi:hypothetical protein
MAQAFLENLNLYRRLGLIPIPLKYRSKEPLVKWGNGWNPTDTEVQKWQKSGCNWGVRCGPELAVLDFDSPDTFQDFLQAHPESALWPGVKTARGFHIWVKPRAPVGSQRVTAVEIKCTGSYIVAPPSVYPSGIRYVFEVEPSGALPEVDLEAMLGLTSATSRRAKEPVTSRQLARPQQQAAEQVLLQYLPGAHYVGNELVGYLDPDSKSKAHVKVNLEKGVFMDWRKGRGGTVVELLRLLGALVPTELGGMGDAEYLHDWGCGELVVVLRRDGVPIWTGKAFCMKWTCPECAIRMKNILKRRLQKVKVTAILGHQKKSWWLRL